MATVQKLIYRVGVSFLYAFVSLSNQGCIHVKSHETVEVSRPEVHDADRGVEMQKGDGFEIVNVLYRPSKLPLSDFFSRLRKGEFKDAFRKIDLDYKQSNSNDRALIELVEHGYIPAYVQFKNTANSSISFNEKDFALVSESHQLKAFYADQLPKEFKSLNPKAVAANVYNIGVITVSFLAVIVAMAVVSSSVTGSPDWEKLPGPTADPVLNETDRTTKIDYRG